MTSAIVTPAPMKKRQSVDAHQHSIEGSQEQPRRSAIVEPKRKPQTMQTIFGPASDDYDPEAHRLAGEKADELFREIGRRAAREE